MSRLAKNIAYNLTGQSLLLVLGFAAVRYVFLRLGEDALGLIYFTATMSTILSAVLELGICSSTVREVSAHLDDEPVYVRKLIRTASLFYWSAYALLAVAVYRAAPFLVEKWIHSRTMDPATATRMLQVLGVAALVALPRLFYVSLLRGLQRMEFNSFIDVSTRLLRRPALGQGQQSQDPCVHEFLLTTRRFVIDRDLQNKLLITTAPDGYLRCVGA